MKPDDPSVEERINNIYSFFSDLISNHLFFRKLGKKEIRVLELGSGTGIVGSILSKALLDRGYEPYIMFTDIREEDLKYVDKWIEKLEIKDIRYDVRVLDCREIPSNIKDGKFDVIIFWGSSLAHLDVYDLILTLSGIYEISNEMSMVIFEQANLGWNLLKGKMFKEFLVEGRITEDGNALISIFSGYDVEKGVQFRSYYIIPGFKYVGKIKSRLWDIASVIGFTWIFFNNVEVLEIKEFRGTYAVIGWEKRGRIIGWRTFYRRWREGIH